MCAPGGHGLAQVSQPAGQVTMVSQFGTALPVGEAFGALVTAYVGCCVGVMPAPSDSGPPLYVAGVWYCPDPAVVLVGCWYPPELVAPYARAKGLGMAMARVWAVRREVMRSDDDGSIVRI